MGRQEKSGCTYDFSRNQIRASVYEPFENVIKEITKINKICSLGVGDCVCVPTKDKSGLLGEVVKCYILKGSTELTFKQIADRLTDKLELYKRPVEYDWIEEIPQTASGKKQRINLK